MTDVPSSGLVLGIETSCDETAAAVVRAGRHVLSNTIASQIALHARFGGVVPELASREHLRHIVPVVRTAMADAAVTFAELSAIAVTAGPGLSGALLVGITYAKSLAFGLGLPLIAVNHLEGHIHAAVLDAHRTEAMPAAFPHLALVVSGGHTHLYLIESGLTAPWHYRNIGRTVDDAAGEAFDKVAKLLGLGYPGGPMIDRLAPFGDPAAVVFNFHSLKPRALDPSSQAPQAPRFDFSFSGTKTAVLRYVQAHALAPAAHIRQAALAESPPATPAEAAALCDPTTLNLIASFQSAVIGNLMRQTFAAAEHFGVRALLISGGVAANSELRRRFTAEARRRAMPIAFPTPALATDNAAMIAAAAWPRLLAGQHAPDTLTANPQLKLGA